MIKYCSKCGKELPEMTRFCPECGTKLWGFEDEPTYPTASVQRPVQNNDEGIGIWIFLGVLISWFTLLGGVILAIVLYACGQSERGKGVLIGVGVAVLIGIALVGLILLMVGASSTSVMI